MDQVFAGQPVETTCFLLELLALDSHFLGRNRRTYRHACSARTVTDITQEELLHGELYLHACVLHDVGIAEIAGRKVAYHAILATLECSSFREELPEVDVWICHDYLLEFNDITECPPIYGIMVGFPSASRHIKGRFLTSFEGSQSSRFGVLDIAAYFLQGASGECFLSDFLCLLWN